MRFLDGVIAALYKVNIFGKKRMLKVMIDKNPETFGSIVDAMLQLFLFSQLAG